jgi:hypothetical protein
MGIATEEHWDEEIDQARDVSERFRLHVGVNLLRGPGFPGWWVPLEDHRVTLSG